MTNDLKTNGLTPSIVSDVAEVAKALPPQKDEKGHYARWGRKVSERGAYALLKHYFHAPGPVAKVVAKVAAHTSSIAVATKYIDKKNDAKKKPSPPLKTGPNCAM